MGTQYLDLLTFKALITTTADNILIIFIIIILLLLFVCLLVVVFCLFVFCHVLLFVVCFSFSFPEKIRLDISCELSAELFYFL